MAKNVKINFTLQKSQGFDKNVKTNVKMSKNVKMIKKLYKKSQGRVITSYNQSKVTSDGNKSQNGNKSI